MIPPRCVLYLRTSSKGQKDKVTIAVQERVLPAYAAQMGWTVVGVYVDDGRSGKTNDREDFQRLLADIPKKLFEIVLVINYDRISRSDSDEVQGLIRDTLRNAGVDWASPATGRRSLNGLAGRMLSAIDGAHSADEGIKILERTAAGRLEARRQGDRRPAGPPPYGYSWRYIQKRHGRFEINEDEAKLVRRIFELAITIGVEPITRILNEEGFKTRKEGHWTHHCVRILLRSPTVMGQFNVKAEDQKFIIAVPPIIEKSLWEKVQDTLNSRRSDPAPGSQRVPKLLSGMMRCGTCGNSMESMNSGTMNYWRCRSTRWKSLGLEKPCGQPHHQAEPLERAVWARIEEIVLRPERIERAGKSKGSKVPNKAEAMQAKLLGLDQHEKRILERSRRGLISEDILDKELSATQRERAQLRQDLATVQAPKQISVDRAELAKRINDSSTVVRRQLLRTVLGASGKIVVDGKKIKVLSVLG